MNQRTTGGDCSPGAGRSARETSPLFSNPDVYVWEEGVLFSSPDVYVWGEGAPHFVSAAPLGARSGPRPTGSPKGDRLEKEMLWVNARPAGVNAWAREKLRLCLLLAALFLLAASARADKVGDIEVAVQPLPNKESRQGPNAYSVTTGTIHGYIEYRVQLKNSSTKEHIVHLRYPADPPYGNVNYGVIAARTVRVAGGQEVSVSLYQPPVEAAAMDMEVRVEGVREPAKIFVGTLYDGNRFGYGSPQKLRAAVLLSRSVPQDFRDRGQKIKAASPPRADDPDAESSQPETPVTFPPGFSSSAPATSPATPPTDDFEFLRSELPVSQWSANWLGYSCYDVILVTQRDVDQMPSQAQLAIRRYLECGGTLLVHGEKVPAVFAEGGAEDGNGGLLIGLGCALASQSDDSDWDATYRKLAAASPHVYWPRERPTNLFDLLVKEATVPIRGLFMLVLLFGVGIGPVNIWLLSRYKRRIWLWWNVPAISFLTCLAVFCYASFSEGWSGHGRTASLTLLDERYHRATTIGYVSYYCPLTPSAGPQFSVDTDVAMLSPRTDWRQFYPGRETSLRFVDWTSGQQLRSGWVNARVPAYFQIRKNEDRRERLSVEKRADGSLVVVNAFGTDIRRLCLADEAGHVFQGRDIAAGATQTLKAAADNSLAPEGGQIFLHREFASADWLGLFHNWTVSEVPAAMLVRGSYIAFLENSPFVEQPLEGVNSEHTVAIVYGISKGADDGR
jgi:hypothetical protein